MLSSHAHLAREADTLAEAANLYDAGMTSHASVSVMLGLEDAFDVEFPERYLKRATFESILSIREAIDELFGD